MERKEDAGITEARSLLHHDLFVAKVGHADAAIFLRHPHAEQPHFAGFDERLSIDYALLVPAFRVRPDLFLHEAPHRIAEHLMIFVKYAAFHSYLPLNAGARFSRKA